MRNDQEPNGTQLGGSFMGWNFNVRGAQAILVVVLLVLVVLVLYGATSLARTVTEALNEKGVRELATKIEEEKNAHAQALQAHDERIANEHANLGNTIKSLNATMEEQNYISTLNDKDRADLKNKLRVPPTLKDKMK